MGAPAWDGVPASAAEPPGSFLEESKRSNPIRLKNVGFIRRKENVYVNQPLAIIFTFCTKLANIFLPSKLFI